MAMIPNEKTAKKQQHLADSSHVPKNILPQEQPRSMLIENVPIVLKTK